MRNSAFRKKKTWRRFPRAERPDSIVRKCCLAALLLEAAVLAERGGLPPALSIRVEDSRVLTSPEVGPPENVFGIRVRIRDGAIEFYRTEDSVREISGAGE